MPKLIKVPAHCGCQGCYFDEHEGCDVDKYIETVGLPIPDYKLWDCNNEHEAFIFVEEGAMLPWEQGDNDESTV